MIGISISTFEKAILKEFKNKNVSIFAGAGLSRGSGFVDWKGLLRDIAGELNLNIDKEHDLVAVAQYYYNAYGRQTLNETIIHEFQRTSERNKNMDILSRLPIYTYWTTNYDSIIEDTLSSAYKVVDVKKTQSQMKNYTPNRDAVVYKMHGDKDFPDEAVITRDDYERYDIDRVLFTTQLRGELISKTFIFIGFSFEDPNLEQILCKIRIDLLGKSPKNHYCFFRKVNKLDNRYKMIDGYINEEEYNYDKVRQELKIEDLKRYGINSVLIDEYSDITRILEDIEKKISVDRVFISGSAYEYGEYTKENAISLLHNISNSLISNDYHIISGFGLGVGIYVINGALEAIFKNNNKKISDYIILRPFPQFESSGKKLKELWNDYREEMISESGVVIFTFGNKINDTGIVVEADGMMEEFKIAKKMKKYIIPVASTGYAAKEIFNEIKNDFSTYWYLKDSIDVLENDKDENRIIKEINVIIERIRKVM